MPQLSEYDREREANIARNRALLEELELKAAVSQLGISSSKAKPPQNKNAKPIQPLKKIKKEVTEVEAPRRQSARLRKTVADLNESPAKKRKREKEEEDQRQKEENERLEAEERAQLAKRPRHQDLKLSTLAEELSPNDVSGLSKHFESMPQTTETKRIADNDAFVFESEEKESQAVSSLKEKLQNLKVVARAKVTQDRVYSAAYHPEVRKDLIFFGDKHGQLGIWDARAPPEEVTDEDDDVASADDKEGGKYWRLQMHWPATSKSSISTVKINPIDSHSIFTSSYDCTIRSLSFTSGVSQEVFSADDTLISSIDLPPYGQEMWISDALGGLTHLDLREHKSKVRWYGLSDQKIGSVSINPATPHFLLAASNSRTLRIWDARKLQRMKHTGETEFEFDLDSVNSYAEAKEGKGVLRGEWRHGKSVSSAYWDPRGRGVVSTSYDDTLRLWDVEESKFKGWSPLHSFRPFKQINHNCQTGKWLTILKAQWSPNPDVYPHFTIGNMNHSLDIFSCKGDVLCKLSDRQKISAVQAVTCSHPNIVERAASGNASGRCVLWAPQDLT